ncbi:MAG: ROK family transcriptional regulator [Dermatophilaceae bacterium]
MSQIRPGSKELIREINEMIVFGEIRSKPLSSRTDIAKRTGLSLPTVSGITAQLLGSELIEERDTGVSAGGRRPVLLALRPEAGYVVGIKLTENTVIAVLTDLEATIVAKECVETEDSSVDSVVRAVQIAVNRLTPSAGQSTIHGVGVGLAGVIDRDRGLVRHATYSNWYDIELGALLSAELGLPVVVDNDVNALITCEQWFGAGRGVSDFVVISIGRGIGLGMVLGGRLYRGASGGAGEFGHTKVASGPVCVCGGLGCLEALTSDLAISNQVSQGLGREVDVTEAAALARSGIQTARSAFADAGRLLGTAAGNVVNVLNPALILLAGEGTDAFDLMLDDFHAGLSAAVFDGLQHELKVVVHAWDDQAWARGSASLLLGELFEPKLHARDVRRFSLTARNAS